MHQACPGTLSCELQETPGPPQRWTTVAWSTFGGHTQSSATELQARSCLWFDSLPSCPRPQGNAPHAKQYRHKLLALTPLLLWGGCRWAAGQLQLLAHWPSAPGQGRDQCIQGHSKRQGGPVLRLVQPTSCLAVVHSAVPLHCLFADEGRHVHPASVCCCSKPQLCLTSLCLLLVHGNQAGCAS